MTRMWGLLFVMATLCWAGLLMAILSGCSSDEYSSGGGGSCVVCYDTTGVDGDPATVCENDSGLNCLTPI